MWHVEREISQSLALSLQSIGDGRHIIKVQIHLSLQITRARRKLGLLEEI